MIRAFKYRLYPNRKQIQSIEQQLELHRYLYNCALEHRIDCYKKYNRSVYYYDQAIALKDIRTDNDEFNQCNYSSLQQTLRKLDKAYKAFFNRIKNGEQAGFPRFKGKNRFNAIQYGSFGDGCSIKNNKLYLQNIREIKVKWHRPVNGTIKTICITRKNNRFYACFFVETVPVPQPKTGKSIGIDMGLKSFLVTSDGTYVDPPKYFKTSEKKLKQRQQKFSRRINGSNRRRKAKQQVSNIHEKIVNQRLDFIHKITRTLIDHYDFIAVENLKINNMVKNKHLAKSILDAGWGMFLQILKYKAEEAGKQVFEVDPKGTSQMCSVCGNVVKKDLSVRVHNCPYCSSILNRDYNASLNILQKARTELSALAQISWASPRSSRIYL